MAWASVARVVIELRSASRRTSSCATCPRTPVSHSLAPSSLTACAAFTIPTASWVSAAPGTNTLATVTPRSESAHAVTRCRPVKLSARPPRPSRPSSHHAVQHHLDHPSDPLGIDRPQQRQQHHAMTERHQRRRQLGNVALLFANQLGGVTIGGDVGKGRHHLNNPT